MARNYDDHSSIRRYLLNQLKDEMLQVTEHRLLTEDEFFAELEIVEDELIDEYVAEKLSDDERERFKQYFLATPERQQKVRFSRSLNRYVNRLASNNERALASGFWSSKSRYLQAAGAVAVMVIIAGVFLVARLQTSSTPFVVFTVPLSHSSRSEGPQPTKVPLQLNARVLRLRLELSQTAKTATSYRVELVPESGKTEALPTIGRDEQSVVVDIPVSQLSRGHYALKVYAVHADGTEQRITGSHYFTME